MRVIDFLSRKSGGLAVGGTFTAIVVWMIFVVPLYSSEVIPQPAGWGDHSGKSELRGIYVVTESRPSQLTDEVIQLGIQYVKAETGWEIPEVKFGPAPIEKCPGWDAERWGSAPPNIPCKTGWILVLQDDLLLASPPTDGKQVFGRTFLQDLDEDGRPDFPTTRATIILTDGSLDSDGMYEPGSPLHGLTPPQNAYANLWTHELLHGLGYGHTFTRVDQGCSFLVQERTGSIMNKNLLKGGWNGSGLDSWDPSRKSSYEKKVD